MELDKLHKELTEGLIISAEESRGIIFSFGEGVGAVYSAKNPIKETSNEDTAVVLPVGERQCIFAVSDGVSGAKGGVEASRKTIEGLCSRILNVVREGGKLSEGIVDGFEEANKRVMALGIGAKATLSLMAFQNGIARAYHVGDSLMMVVGQGGVVRYRSEAHSPISHDIKAGRLGEKEALFHPERHVVTNAIGSSDMKVEIGPSLGISSRDTVLIASDGLSDNLWQSEIVRGLRPGSLAVCLCKFAELCQVRMTQKIEGQPSNPDDLTFVLFRMK